MALASRFWLSRTMFRSALGLRLSGHVLVVVSCIGCLQSIAAEAASEPRQYSMAEVSGVWRARERQYEECRIRWVDTTTLTNKSVNVDAGKEPQLPRSGQQFKANGELLLKSKLLKFATSGTITFNPTKSRYFQHQRISAFDGRGNKTLTGKSEYSHPLGSIDSRPVAHGADMLHVKPLFWTCRPTDPRKAWFDVKKLKVVGVEEIDGRSLLRLDQGLWWRLWVDPARRFAIKKAMVFNGDRLYCQVDLQYSSGPNVDSPARIRVMLHNKDGDLHSSHDMVIQEFSANPGLTAQDFAFDFPHGTQVTDISGDKAKYYIVKTNGQKRPILDSEFGKSLTYEDLLRSEPGELTEPTETSHSSVLYIVFGLCALAALLFLLLRVRSHRNQSDK